LQYNFILVLFVLFKLTFFCLNNEGKLGQWNKCKSGGSEVQFVQTICEQFLLLYAELAKVLV